MMLSNSVESGSWPWSPFLLHVWKSDRFFSFLSSRLFLSPSSRPYFSRLPWLCGRLKCSTWARVSWTWQVSVSHTSTHHAHIQTGFRVHLRSNVRGHIRWCQAIQIFCCFKNRNVTRSSKNGSQWPLGGRLPGPHKENWLNSLSFRCKHCIHLLHEVIMSTGGLHKDRNTNVGVI